LAGAVDSEDGLSLTHRGHFDFRFDKVFPLLHNPVPEELYARDTLEIDMASFVGLLVKSEAIRQIGLPRKEFFLHNDDAEYCIRLRTQGRILLVPGSRVEHKDIRWGSEENRSWLFFSSARPAYDQLWMMYYGLRNLTWVGRTYHHSAARFFSATLYSWLRAVASVLLFDRDHKWTRVRFLTNAYADGLRGVFDNAKPRRILYGRGEKEH
jgi:GT2 family glycosyltransferase